MRALPAEVGGYAEPFLDGGAMAIAVLGAHPSAFVTLASESATVIEVWQVVRDDVDGLVRTLRMLADRHSPAFFAGVRDRDLAPGAAAGLSPAERAARYVYLRGTARPDAAGETPRDVTDAVFGRDRVPIDEAGLKSLSRLLGERDVDFAVRAPFALLPSLREEDVVWIDPAAARAQSRSSDVGGLERELRSLVASVVARGALVLAPSDALVAGSRELVTVLGPDDGLTLLGSTGLLRALAR